MNNKISYTLNFIIVIAAFLIINLLSYIFQERITHNDGKGWDGVYYYSAAEQIVHGQRPAEIGPFVYRIGTYFIPTLLDPGNLKNGFFLSDLIANFLTTILLVIWFRQYFSDWKLRTLLTILFILQWFGPVRFSHYYSIYNDPWAFTFTIAGLILVKSVISKPMFVNLLLFNLIVFFGMMFRETMIIIPISLLFANNPIGSFKRLYPLERKKMETHIRALFPVRYMIPFLTAICSGILTHAFVQQTNDFSAIRTALGAAYIRSLFEYVLAWFTSYGPLIVLCLYSWRIIWNFLLNNQFFLVFLLGTAISAWCGGFDIERYLFTGAPVVYILIGIAILDNMASLRRLPLMFLLIVTQLISERIFWTIPDYPNNFSTPLPFLTVWSNQFQHHDLYATLGQHYILVTTLFEYIVLSILILFMLNYYRNESKMTKKFSKAHRKQRKVHL